MSELRWLLLAAGIFALVIVFWLSRREASQGSSKPPSFLRQRLPSLSADGGAAGAPTANLGKQEEAGGRQAAISGTRGVQRIVTVRLTGRGNASFQGEALVLALREVGLRHGRFGIFHRHDPKADSATLFSVASLVEPGSFDLTRVKAERFPGVSFFLTLPAANDAITAFDDMLATAHSLALKLEGELLDEQGSRLSVQRERYLREEVIQFQHKRSPA